MAGLRLQSVPLSEFMVEMAETYNVQIEATVADAVLSAINSAKGESEDVEVEAAPQVRYMVYIGKRTPNVLAGKIQAIKLIRKYADLGLLEAKDLIETLDEEGTASFPVALLDGFEEAKSLYNALLETNYSSYITKIEEVDGDEIAWVVWGSSPEAPEGSDDDDAPTDTYNELIDLVASFNHMNRYKRWPDDLTKPNHRYG